MRHRRIVVRTSTSLVRYMYINGVCRLNWNLIYIPLVPQLHNSLISSKLPIDNISAAVILRIDPSKNMIRSNRATSNRETILPTKIFSTGSRANGKINYIFVRVW